MCHLEQALFSAAKDLGEPRVASQPVLREGNRLKGSLRRNNRAFGSLPYDLRPFMRKPCILVLCVVCPLLFSSCSPRDFLTRRLAADLIANSTTFRAPQQFDFSTGVISNQDYLSPKYVALQHRGWISGAVARCPPTLASPCWDVTLTPSGVDTFQSLLAPGDAEKQSFSVPVARRELVAITGIAKQGNTADVEFTWKWTPLNEVGAAIYSGDVHFRSTTSFRSYDDGWRVVEGTSHTGEPLDEAIKKAEPVS